MSYRLIQKLLYINIIILSNGGYMREVTILVKNNDIEEKLREMNKNGINITLWFYEQVRKYDLNSGK